MPTTGVPHRSRREIKASRRSVMPFRGTTGALGQGRRPFSCDDRTPPAERPSSFVGRPAFYRAKARFLRQRAVPLPGEKGHCRARRTTSSTPQARLSRGTPTVLGLRLSSLGLGEGRLEPSPALLGARTLLPRFRSAVSRERSRGPSVRPVRFPQARPTHDLLPRASSPASRASRRRAPGRSAREPGARPKGG
jgi:hypothetical protein